MGNGTTSGTHTGTNGATSGSNGGPPDGWTRLADLTGTLGRSGRWLREWAAGNLSEQLVARVRRSAGGAPELWLAPSAVDQLVQRYGNGTAGGRTPEPTEPPAEATAEQDAGWRVALTTATARVDAAEALSRERAVELDALRRELVAARQDRDRAQLVAEEAERGRHAAELRLAEVRTAAWAWVAQVRGLAWWRRLRRLPEPPAGLVAHERLLAKPEG